MTATVHLISGGTGAGKTTYAIALASDTAAVRFSIDEAMTTLFDADKPEDASFDWYMDRIGRIEADIWRTATRIAPHSINIVLDLGFSLRDHREAFRARAEAADLAVQLHYLDVETEERWRRVEARNREKGETFRLEVTRTMFDFVDAMFEVPDSAEIARLNGVLVKNTP